MIAWDQLGHLESSGTIWVHLAHLGSSHLGSSLRSRGIIWAHLATSGIIWEDYGRIPKGLWEVLEGLQEVSTLGFHPQLGDAYWKRKASFTNTVRIPSE